MKSLSAAITLFCFALLCSGYVMAAEESPQLAEEKLPFLKPFSFQMNFISDLDWNGLSQLGSYGMTEFVVKQNPAVSPMKYRTFDDSIVVTINAASLSKSRLQEIRQMIRKEVKKSHFRVVDPKESEAGIAAIFSPFRTESGAKTWELLVVIFDRPQMRQVMADNPQKRALDAVFESSVRVMVSHLYPATDIDFAGQEGEPAGTDALKKLVTKVFSNFMEATEKDKSKPGA